jgi:Putative polyhydroxyalkanoic acid system protein (PHA_gran_rgn)
MKHEIAHDLDVAAAKNVADRAFEEYRGRFPKYEPTMSWVSDRRAEISFNAKGIRLNGAMLIAEKTITLELNAPFLFRPFQKIAIDIIEREVKAWIEKARTGTI